MSASLVGSEMCIRDSYFSSNRVVLSAGFQGQIPPAYLDKITRVEDGRVPVSYTHLTLPTICSV
eukprot:7872671-Alexandrium_andersonii.AAC.1